MLFFLNVNVFTNLKWNIILLKSKVTLLFSTHERLYITFFTWYENRFVMSVSAMGNLGFILWLLGRPTVGGLELPVNPRTVICPYFIFCRELITFVYL